MLLTGENQKNPSGRNGFQWMYGTCCALVYLMFVPSSFTLLMFRGPSMCTCGVLASCFQAEMGWWGWLFVGLHLVVALVGCAWFGRRFCLTGNKVFLVLGLCALIVFEATVEGALAVVLLLKLL